MAKTKNQTEKVVEPKATVPPVVVPPTPPPAAPIECEVCGRPCKSPLSLAIHKGFAHRDGKAKPKADKPAKPAKAPADAPATVTITVPRSKLPALLDAAGRLGWAEVVIRF